MIRRDLIRKRKSITPKTEEEELFAPITHEELQKSHGLRTKLMNCRQYIGSNPTQEKVISYIKHCAVADLREQLGREPTRDEAIIYLRAIKRFITDGTLEKFKEEFMLDTPF